MKLGLCLWASAIFPRGMFPPFLEGGHKEGTERGLGRHQHKKAVMVRYQLRNFSKTSKRPRRSYDKERLDAELKLIGTYGLKNKREIWRVGLVLSKVRAVARQLLTLEERVSDAPLIAYNCAAQAPPSRKCLGPRGRLG